MGTIVFANFLAPNMTSTYAFVAAQVGQRLGVRTALVEGTSLDQLRDASVDVAFLCSLPYVRLCQEQPSMLRPLAAPVLDEPRYRGRPVYFSDVIVRRDSSCRSFTELRGRTWAHNCEDSFSGCLLTRYHLRQMGETEAFFAQVTYSGAHQESIRRVVAGEVDASAIDSHVLGVERRRNPNLVRQLRVIDILGPSTIPPVVASARLSEALVSRVRDALGELGDDPGSRLALARGLIRRFVPIDDRAYDHIRQTLAALEGSRPRSNELAGLGA